MIKYKISIFALFILILSLNVFFVPSKNVCAVGANLTSAKAMCLIEMETGKIFYEKNKDEKLANASTTKICTAITVIQNCQNLDEVISVNDLAIGISGTSIYLRKNEQIKVRDLLYGLMLRSGNDSACALAYHVGGSLEKFADLMNETAKKAGAENTHFSNPHGLDEKDHYTTAYDLAKITAYALKNPIFKEIVSTKMHTVDETNVSDTRYFANKNKLLNSLDGCVGVKTGFTNKAGRCLVSAVERDNMTLVCVVLNCGPMFEESAVLLNKGFDEYENACVVDSKKPIYNEYYYNSTRGQLNLMSEEDYYLPIKKNQENEVIVKYYLNEFQGDIEEGQEVGKIEVYCDKHLQKTIKLYTINRIDVLNELDALKSIQLQWEEKYEIK